jgi:hypothetical protein
MATVLVVSGCSAQSGDTAPGTPGTPAATASGVPTATPTSDAAPHAVSLPALMDKRFDGRKLRLRRVLDVADAYTKYAISYRGSGLRISGVLCLPSGDGPFPALVLNHGYIDPEVYVTVQGLQIEQDYLARAGFVVLHTDYRNHAGSDDDPRNGVRLRLGYTEDSINAVQALRRSGLPQVDPARPTRAFMVTPPDSSTRPSCTPRSVPDVRQPPDVDASGQPRAGSPDRAPLRHSGEEPRLLARRLPPNPFRADRRSSTRPPRDRRRHLPRRVGR